VIGHQLLHRSVALRRPDQFFPSRSFNADTSSIDYGKAPAVPAAIGLMLYVLPKPLVKASLKPAYGDPSRLSPAVVTRYHDLMLAPGSRRALLARMRQAVLTDPRPALRSIQAPVLLMWGERDGMIPSANAQDYLRALPHARLAAFPALGHVPQEEDPAPSLDVLRAFLAEPGAAATAGRRPGP
jgi:pimeloyl-ACP methyl ester carboxylesterase